MQAKGEISIETILNNENIDLIICDTGIGINKEILHKIIDPFFNTKSSGKGTGLGLSITYSIIKEHGGNIIFDSEPGKGTKVIVSLLVKK
jgi:signal transduction histidine kinase